MRFASRTSVAALFAFLIVGSSCVERERATPTCDEAGTGWCLERRFAGIVAGGELGFRFGEPLDADGDGRADVAAGARFKRHGVSQNGMAAVWSGADGALIRAWDGTYPDGLFGHWVLPVPDLSGDGLADVVIAAPAAKIDGIIHGILIARSPKTGEVIWKQVGDREGDLGWDLAPGGDQDGDGVGDLFAGAPMGEAGRAHLLSGKTGAVLRTFAPQKGSETFGWYVARIDDLDGDERADVAVGAQLEPDAQGALVGGAYVFSSATGKKIHHWSGTAAFSNFGEVIAGVGDLDGDGSGEIAVAAPRTNDRERMLPGDVWIYSGATGKEIRHWAGGQRGELFGRMLVGAGDLDGDGSEDLAIGAPWYRRDGADRVGRVELRSGRTGDVLSELVGDEPESWFGWHIRRAPDPEDLGRPTLLIGSLRYPVKGKRVGVLDLFVLRGPAAR